MSDSAERKIKLLLLYEILLKQTDELHPSPPYPHDTKGKLAGV